MMHLKYLIFDAGGVLVYPRMGSWIVPARAQALLGPRAADLTGPQAQECAARWLDESRRVDDTRAERALRRSYFEELDRALGWQLDGDTLDALADDFTFNPERYGFFDDVMPALLRWKERYGLGLLSDAMPSLLDVLRGEGLLDLLDAAVISTHVGATKPGEGMYRAILEALKADPGECLFVDDRASNVEGAARMGIHGVQMARPALPAQALWDGPVVRDMAHLNQWLEAGNDR